ncbi:ABC-type transporter, integral membrane subunit [Oleidesulfovibrio alaskensis G20]|jgi:spermidine/putrescine transport system permease protein|uniref:ABC-type transporter, integral membrane subunit n=1 Tax=Oleidesulfovibrio alaskensis (strain ATCC BAA-1058 / DSM 17464 / G20) TaxID=207559 RepID=Q30V32_OLEA2|nr:spermidine/putrescine ABC transporter permease PotB [Oleidesulfovibrio alaskensis]ABB40464.1 ABC-type transporter, integral membrane subunit [Oleidesulfovibrio alaskensis G20]
MMGSKFFRRFSITAVALWLGLFALVPHLMLVGASFLTRDPGSFVAPRLTLDNFIRLFDPMFVRIFLESFRLAGITTAFCLLMGYPFAFLLATAREHLRPWLLLLVIIPFWTNSLIRTYAMIIILKSNGVLSKVLMAAGLIDAPISLMYSEIAVVAGFAYTSLPFMILPLFASIEKLDMRLLDAARDLGASTRQTFFSVTLPLTMPGIVAGCMLVFLPVLGCFYVPEILGGSKTLVMGSFIKNQFLVARDWPLGSAASIVMTLILVVLILLYYMAKKRSATHHKDDELYGEGM